MKKPLLIATVILAAIAAAGVKQLSVPDVEAASKNVFRGFDELSRRGAYVIGEKGELLGTLGSKFSSDSLANSFGKGSSYDSKGIFNTFSKYGDKFSSTSAFNPNATKPPVIVIKEGDKLYSVGYLTTNTFIVTEGQRINPYMLKAWIESQ